MPVDQQTEDVERSRADGNRAKAAFFILTRLDAKAPVKLEAVNPYDIGSGMLLHASASLPRTQRVSDLEA
jgi:hypothetical protein